MWSYRNKAVIMRIKLSASSIELFFSILFSLSNELPTKKREKTSNELNFRLNSFCFEPNENKKTLTDSGSNGIIIAMRCTWHVFFIEEEGERITTKNLLNRFNRQTKFGLLFELILPLAGISFFLFSLSVFLSLTRSLLFSLYSVVRLIATSVTVRLGNACQSKFEITLRQYNTKRNRSIFKSYD